MKNTTFAFLVTLTAGLSTLLGMIPVFLKIKNKKNIINASLSFASGVMLSVSIFSLLPESIELLSKKYNTLGVTLLTIIFALVGIFLTGVIDKVFRKIDNKLYKLGIINCIALILHNIPEGILTFSTTTTNISLGLTLALSIMFHNIPEGISISIPIYYSTKSKLKAFFYTFISGISEFLGAVITYVFLYQYIDFTFISVTLALTFGIMSYISLFELLPNALKYKNKKLSLIAFILGFIFMIFFK
ncbi:MAG: ZIP family metal transporter [Bacilli bacterium]|nr:ZIP family metal transporter [Bacilli bacterium]